MAQFEYKQFYDRNLPHVQPPGATLFVTFRLAGSIPRSILEEWLRERRDLEAKQLRREAIGKAPLDPEVLVQEKLTLQRRWFARFESSLHAETSGPLWLKENGVAQIVSEALRHRDGRVYRLDAYCIMSNHVHVVFAPLLTEIRARELARNARMRMLNGERTTQTDSLRYTDNSVLSRIMHSLKGYTARQCNLALNRSGEFWQHESFDHVVRDQGEFRRIVNYVLNNPVKARLVRRWEDWKWNYCRRGLIDAGLVTTRK